MKLVYCAGAGKANMKIATDLGWWTGSRSDETIGDIHRPLYLLDIHWIAPDWPAHLAVARAERPALAAVPDILCPDQLPAALAMAEEIAPHAGAVLVIPKCDVVDALPRRIGGTPIILGYSVPTAYGGTNLPIWSFAGWPVHLLGGTPKRQVALAGYLDVVSADGNMAQKLANRGIIFNARGQGTQYWEAHNGEPDLPARALARSLGNIAAYWQRAGYRLDPRSTTTTTGASEPAADRGPA